MKALVPSSSGPRRRLLFFPPSSTAPPQGSQPHTHAESARAGAHAEGTFTGGEGGDAGEPERGAEASAGQSRDHPRSCARRRPRRRPEEAAGEPLPPQ